MSSENGANNSLGYIESNSRNLTPIQSGNVIKLIKFIEEFDINQNVSNFNKLFYVGTRIFRDVRTNRFNVNESVNISDGIYTTILDEKIKQLDLNYIQFTDMEYFSVRLLNEKTCYRVTLDKKKDSINSLESLVFKVLSSLNVLNTKRDEIDELDLRRYHIFNSKLSYMIEDNCDI